MCRSLAHPGFFGRFPRSICSITNHMGNQSVNVIEPMNGSPCKRRKCLRILTKRDRLLLKRTMLRFNNLYSNEIQFSVEPWDRGLVVPASAWKGRSLTYGLTGGPVWFQRKACRNKRGSPIRSEGKGRWYGLAL